MSLVARCADWLESKANCVVYGNLCGNVVTNVAVARGVMKQQGNFYNGHVYYSSSISNQSTTLKLLISQLSKN